MAFSAQARSTRGFSRLKLFLALSRTPHGIIDIATPAFAALLWLGAFPPPGITILGLITVFAGYTAVYALNDLVDWRIDRRKLKRSEAAGNPHSTAANTDLDAILVRHPLARGLLPYRAAALWVIGWSAVALCGAWILNPVCLYIFLLGCLLEIIYCMMLKITHLRTIVSGGVKTLGALAAVFAVDPSPSPTYLGCLFLCLFFWEIGGQNIPNDWSDIKEDRRIHARTIPLQLGLQRAATLIVACLITAVCLNLILFQLSQSAFSLPFTWAALVVGTYLLIWPAIRLFRSRQHTHVMALFNQASYYPLALLVIVLIKIST